MKKHIVRYLIEDQGYTPHRLVNGKYIPNNINDFSTMQNGGIDIRYIKGDREIIYGLNEAGRPPTLIYPRPKIILIKNIDGRKRVYTDVFDDTMNICLKKEDPQVIYEAMFDKTKKFRYEE